MKAAEEMTREELIAYDKWLTRRKWGTGEIISPEKAADLYLAEHPLPPAGGAEEIRREYSEESLDFFRSFIKARKELCAISPTETYSLEEAIRKAFDGIFPRPTAEGAEIDDMMFTISEDGINPLDDEPTAEGAEEIKNFFKTNISVLTVGEDNEGNNVHLGTDDFLIGEICHLSDVAMREFATLHAQRLADKMVEERCAKCEKR